MDIPKSLYTTMRFNFLYVDKYLFKEGWIYPESYVPYCMLRYILKGTAVFTIDGVKYVVGPNQVAYIPDGCMLNCCSLEEQFEFISVRFVTTARLNGNDFLTEFFHLAPVVDVLDSTILSCFEEIYQNATSGKLSRLFHIRGNLELILAYLVDQQSGEGSDLAQKKDRQNSAQEVGSESFSVQRIYHRAQNTFSIKRDPRIQTVVDYLIAHPEEPYNVAYLCEVAKMSPSSFRRHFKEHTGKTPGDFVKELRVMVAARRLLVTDDRISDIAYELGFDDQNYFSRMFKSLFGVSPSQYRKTARS